MTWAPKEKRVSLDFLGCWGRKVKWVQRENLGSQDTEAPQGDQENEANRVRRETVELWAHQASLGLLVNLAVKVLQGPQAPPLQDNL